VVDAEGWLESEIWWYHSGDAFAPWAARYGGQTLALRLGDFPAEPLYTLVVDGIDALSVDDWPAGWTRVVVLRDERDGQERRSLVAYVNPDNGLTIDGQDLGPSVEQWFGEGIREYEWMRTVDADEVPRLVELLGGPPGANVLDALEAWLPSHAATDLEKLIDEHELRGTVWRRTGD